MPYLFRGQSCQRTIGGGSPVRVHVRMGLRSTDWDKRLMNGFNPADRQFGFILLTVREWLEWGHEDQFAVQKRVPAMG